MSPVGFRPDRGAKDMNLRRHAITSALSIQLFAALACGAQAPSSPAAGSSLVQPFLTSHKPVESRLWKAQIDPQDIETTDEGFHYARSNRRHS